MTKDNVTIRMKVYRATAQTGDPLPGGSEASISAEQKGVTRVVPGPVTISAVPVPGKANTFQVSGVVDLAVYVTYNGTPELYVQYAEYQHYAAFADGLNELADSLADKFHSTRFGRQSDIVDRYTRVARNTTNLWYNGRASLSTDFDAAGGSHSLNGPAIVVPKNFPGF